MARVFINVRISTAGRVLIRLAVFLSQFGRVDFGQVFDVVRREYVEARIDGGPWRPLKRTE